MPQQYIRQFYLLTFLSILLVPVYGQVIEDSLDKRFNTLKLTVPRNISDKPTITLPDSLTKFGSRPILRWQDAYLNPFTRTYLTSPFYTFAPSNTKTSIFYHSKSGRFDVSDNFTDSLSLPYTPAQSLSFNEYSSLQNAAIRRSIMRDYERLADGNSNVSGRGLNPSIEKNPVLDRIFGGKIPEFSPTGFISVDLRVGQQFNNNPTIPIFNRRQPVFQLDPQINFNFNSLFQGGSGSTPGIGQVGNLPNNFPNVNDLDRFGNIKTLPGQLDQFGNIKDKLGVVGNFDTKSAFSTENKLRINYRNEPENILQAIELGNVSMPLHSQLIPGVENLQGGKVGLRFGKLYVTSVFANQQSRTESIIINGGNQTRPFEVRVDNYDENRHFFLGQFFRDNYEKSLRNLPMVLSGVRITRVEVYVTNRTNTVESMRNLVGLADLGEPKPYNSALTGKGTTADNDANNLYGELLANKSFRKLDSTSNLLPSLGLKKGVDFELLRAAKRLTDREYILQPELGYISLFTPLRNDEVLAVAYEYTYNGTKYQVGELSEDYSILPEDQVIALKLIKSSTIRNHLNLPMWDLMMKNVYSLGQGQIEREGFQLRIIYKDDRTGIDNPNLQEGKLLKDRPLIEVMNLDALNYNLDHQPDGNFDYIENVTINQQYGRIIFPVLEPFGSHLAENFTPNEPFLKEKYVFQELYDKTMTDAQQVNTKNKFFLNGSVRLSSREIPLPLGASGASVRVYAGGVELKPGVDYTVDNQLGRIRLTNESILNSSRQIRIDYERPDLFQAQLRRLFGLRLDYNVNRYLRIGGTLMDMREATPGFLTRTAIGNEPVNNTMWGLDMNLKTNWYGLTRALDKLPFVETKETSAIQLTAEFAQLRPGVNNKRVNGNAMIDDFEATRNINDMTRQPTRWRLASTPENFDERGKDGELGYNFRRAKMSVYTIDPSSFLNVGLLGNTDITAGTSNNIYEKIYQPQDIFPGRSRPALGTQLPTNVLDVSYFPEERGMYNYNRNLTNDGFLPNPRQNFGAAIRGITADADFDNANVEYLEFWLLNPFKDNVRDGFKNKTNKTGGKLLFHLGDISEDVIPDNRFNFENGLAADSSSLNQPVTTFWGKAPRSQYTTDAFANSDEARARQDVGLEGLPNTEEKSFYRDYLVTVNGTINNPSKPPTPDAQRILADINRDPSGDDFIFFSSDAFREDASFIERYKNYLGMENNTPVTTGNSQVALSNSVTADKEDVNDDNTVNDVEAYYEYEIDLQPNTLQVNHGYIVDRVVSESDSRAEWLLFRIPLRQFTRKYGDISGFKSMRFMRMVMTDWEEPVVCRFATLQLVANQYRVYPYDLSNAGLSEVPEPYDAKFKVATANIEENGCDENGNCNNIKEGRTPYVVPPGFIRDRDFMQVGTQFKFNEQSISLGVTDLRDGDSRAVFKNTKVDLNMYKRLQMFVHMENLDETQNYGVGAFIRLGTDVRENYYEIELSDLKTTPNDNLLQDATQIWPVENEFDFPLDLLRQLKIERNLSNYDLSDRYSKEVVVDGFAFDPEDQQRDLSVTRKYKVTVVGNPDLSNVLTLMLGVSNPVSDDQKPKTFTVWMDELRANGFDQTPGEAGILAADIKLADIGTLLLNGNFTNYGFGGVQDRISARSREDLFSLGVAANLQLDRFMPQNWGLNVPFLISYDWQQVKPHFNPLDPDIPMELALSGIADPARREAYRKMVIDNSVRRGFNFTNVRKVKTDLSKKNHFYDIENFAFTYVNNRSTRTNILIDEYLSEQTRGGLSYLYQPKPITWEPFKDKQFKEGRSLWIKEFNFSPIPTVISFRTDYDRNYTKMLFRNDASQSENLTLPNYQKFFFANRTYDVQWNLSRSLNLTYNAVMNAIIDEPYDIFLKTLGRPKDYRQRMDLTWRMPFDKMFWLDWMQADSKYNNQFSYRANSFGIRESYPDGALFGNYAENGREIGIRGRADLVKLYNKFKYLRFANTPKAPSQSFTRAYGDDESLETGGSDLARSLTRLLMTVRGINVNYSNIRTTVLPGFLPQPRFFGMSDDFRSLPFVLGDQRHYFDPTDSTGTRGGLLLHNKEGWLYQANKSGWLSNNSLRNDPFIQSRIQRFDYSINLEPFKGLRMQIRGEYSRGDDYQILYRPLEVGGQNQVLSAIRNGNMSMSFWSFKTLRKGMDFNFFSTNKNSGNVPDNEIYDLFKQYRYYVSDYLNKELNKGEKGRFDITSQDVLITAFLAAYSGKGLNKSMADQRTDVEKYVFDNLNIDAKGVGAFTNLFKWLPFPNWRIDYGGLEKIPLFSNIFTSLTLNHSYQSTYNVGNYTSSLDYGGNSTDNLANLVYLNLLANDYTYGFKPITDVLKSTLFTPLFIMSTISIEEKFGPIIGVNFRLKNSMTGRVDWNLERKSGLNLSNLQVAEYSRNDLVMTLGFRKNNVKIPFRGRDGNPIILKNDLNFNMNLQVSDLKMIQRPMESDPIAIQGNYSFQIRPQIQYQFNKQFSGSFYIERLVNSPFASNSFYRSSTIGGINVRFNLSE